MKKLKFPTPYTVLMLVIILAASLTFLLPSGSYSSLEYNKVQDSFVIRTADSVYTLPATQQQLNELGIQIQLSKFKEENWGIMITVFTCSGSLENLRFCMSRIFCIH